MTNTNPPYEVSDIPCPVNTVIRTPSSNTYANVPDGFKVKYSMSDLSRMGVAPKYGKGSSGPVHLLALSTVPNGYKEPWVGYKNFYVITRYNHSNYYAMTVHLLAQAVRERVGK